MDISALPWKDIVTIGAAFLGAVLGIMNTWNAISARKLRVKVTPNFVHALDGQPLGASIEIINLSGFPISIAEVGFQADGGRHLPIMRPNVSLPHRLEPRHSVSLLIQPSTFLPPAGVKIGAAYVRTACGNEIKGNSPAGRQLGKILEKVARSAP